VSTVDMLDGLLAGITSEDIDRMPRAYRQRFAQALRRAPRHPRRPRTAAPTSPLHDGAEVEMGGPAVDEQGASKLRLSPQLGMEDGRRPTISHTARGHCGAHTALEGALCALTPHPDCRARLRISGRARPVPRTAASACRSRRCRSAWGTRRLR
jgi:hypothetical protein